MRIWQFFRGYVMIRVEGLSLEKFLNLAARHDIFVYNARRISYTVLRAGVSASGFKKLKELGAQRFNIVAEKRGGLPSGFKWISRRYALLFGLIVVAAAVLAGSLFIWEVRVTGLEYLETKQMVKELEEHGIRPGVLKGSIDCDAVATRMIIAHNEFAWIDIHCDGVVVTAEIVLADPIPEIVDENTPCSIVADKDAFIESVTALAGEAAVRPGDTVREGDVLISGLVWDDGFPRMLFAARGEVMGNVWYTATATAPVFEEARKPTGRSETERVIIIGRDSASIDGQCTFDEYDTRVVDEYYIGRILPVKIAVLEHSEITVTKMPAELQMIKVYTEERAYYDAQKKVPDDAKIVGHRTFFWVKDDVLNALVYLQTREDIGKVVYLEE